MTDGKSDEEALRRGFFCAVLRGKATLMLAELAAVRGIHQMMITAWKRQAMEGMGASEFLVSPIRLSVSSCSECT